MMTVILAPILVFAVIVLIHESGHFITAKMTGMRVEEFAVGFGPVLFSKKIGETVYSLRLFPLGGFNKISGMSQEGISDPHSFVSKPAWARLIVISAGSVMNFVLAYVIFVAAFNITGIQTFPDIPVIGKVIPDSAAAKAGLLPQDRILSVNGYKVEKWSDIHGQMMDMENRIVTFEIERQGEEKTVHVIPQANRSGEAVIGVTAVLENHPVTLAKSFQLSGDQCLMIVRSMGEGIYYMITGKESVEVAGPIGIARMAGDVADIGPMQLFLFIGLLSLSLGVLNLLPIPLLDGGFLCIILAETFLRHRLPDKALYGIQMVGLSILIGLFLFATMKDISGFFR